MLTVSPQRPARQQESSPSPSPSSHTLTPSLPPSALDGPRQLIPEIIKHLNQPEDARDVREVDELERKADESRARRIERAEDLLKRLTLQVAVTKEDLAQANADAKNKASHSDAMIALEREKYGVEKRARELEAAIESRHKELEQLQKEQEALVLEEKHEANLPKDSKQLMIEIYRQMGVDIRKNERGEYLTCHILNKSKNDIQIYRIDPSVSRTFHADFLWEAMSTE
ncbi:Spc24 subunit of Ndc80-domain-containing protein [Cladochytrium replicatum]|nr:Spc24 subunit of Ndc80-domain-containing protein [Cladochytrium replicatum]